MPSLHTIAIVVFFVWIFLDGIAVFRHKTGAAENRDKSSLKVLMIANMLTWWFCIQWSYGAIGALQVRGVCGKAGSEQVVDWLFSHVGW